jgi:hypothetical protein
MTDPLTTVGVPGILAYLLIREVFGFVKRRNGRSPEDTQQQHATILAKHDQALNDVVNRLKNIDRRLGRIEEHLMRSDG